MTTAATSEARQTQRKKVEIVRKNRGDRFKGVRAEIGRIRLPELGGRPGHDAGQGTDGRPNEEGHTAEEIRLVLLHMLKAIQDALDDIFAYIDEDLEEPEEEEEADDLDLDFTEISRDTSQRYRKVESDDGEVVITVTDAVTSEIRLKNRSGDRMTLRFNPPWV